MSTKVHLVKTMAFPVVMYRCESWTIKKAEHMRTDASGMWCWRRLLRVPWTARRSNHPKGDQSCVFFGRTDVEAETPILWPPDAKSWLIWKDHDVKSWLLRRADWKSWLIWCWERLRAGGEGDDRGWDGWMASPTQWTWVWVDSGSWWWTGRPGVPQFMGLQRVRHDWATELNWTRSKMLLLRLKGKCGSTL